MVFPPPLLSPAKSSSTIQPPWADWVAAVCLGAQQRVPALGRGLVLGSKCPHQGEGAGAWQRVSAPGRTGLVALLVWLPSGQCPTLHSLLPEDDELSTRVREAFCLKLRRPFCVF